MSVWKPESLIIFKNISSVSWLQNSYSFGKVPGPALSQFKQVNIVLTGLVASLSHQSCSAWKFMTKLKEQSL